MANVRGLFVLNTTAFVRETFGAAAHDHVVAGLAPDPRRTFLLTPREAGWYPLLDVVAYMEAAQRLLAPDDAGFHRRLGAFSGERDRNSGGFSRMAPDPATAMRMAPMIWRAFYDAGRLVPEHRTPNLGIGVVHEFPAYPAHCQRICGAWGVLLSFPAAPAQVSEPSCAALGQAHCEFHVVWTPAGDGG